MTADMLVHTAEADTAAVIGVNRYYIINIREEVMRALTTTPWSTGHAVNAAGVAFVIYDGFSYSQP